MSTETPTPLTVADLNAMKQGAIVVAADGLCWRKSWTTQKHPRTRSYRVDCWRCTAPTRDDPTGSFGTPWPAEALVEREGPISLPASDDGESTR